MAPVREALFLLLAFVVGPGVAEHCSTGYSYIYCSYGCCGSSSYQYCCSSSYYSVDSESLAAWHIGLIVTGSIIFVCAVVGIICRCLKSKGHSGTVVAPQSNPGVTVVSSSQQSANNAWGQQPGPSYGPPQGYGYGANPPGYAGPPAYGQPPPGPPTYSDPAYPPGQEKNQSPFVAAANTS